jgi:hypothetical protein
MIILIVKRRRRLFQQNDWHKKHRFWELGLSLLFSSIHLSGMAEQQPYIIAAIFAERRCWGLFSRDSYKMHYKGHKLVVEHNCGMPNDQQQRRRTKEMPFFFLFTEKFSNRMAEITLIIK